MSVAKANKRKYKEDYIRYGVACLQNDGEYIPQGYIVHENTGAKKSWDFAELVQSCIRNCAKLVLDDTACNTLKQVSPSNNTIKSFTINPRIEMLVKWK